MQGVQSPIIPIVGELIRSYPGTISLGQGVVYYGPPPQAFEQMTQFLTDPENHKYKPVQGITPLLDALETKLKAFNGISIEQESCIVVTAGSNMAFMNAVMAITAPGDEIILLTPYYFNHEMAIAMASCRAVMVATDENYQLRPDAIRQAITDKTRAVVTISPNNPTGVVYSQEALQEVNEICRDRNIYHISDEAYEYFTYNGVQHFSPGAIPQSSQHTISLYSLSKAYGFASWRIGYMVIPAHLLASVKKIQDTILICPPVISQYAAIGALQAGANYCLQKLQTIAEVRQMVLHELGNLGDFCTIPPADGAFYFLLKIHTQLSAIELVERLIREYRVALIPGTTFGMENGCYLRLAYGAMLHETAKEGIGRLVRGLQAILESN
ncbi:MAG: pyridoxal phosphate-dependent aminotransferase [Aphanothece sp. CMT-3BRIN-NPC111]|jgi:aspartate/methionine/tyrosine aminotransferase|nr:pyridoxal phosphate-dependent aminotransferase [Aphanothece sp. CMT-3BRIN-NPC111]